MKRNGFTLIELLAVIVILAIIAIIATPIVLNIINNAKTSSNERSGELYIKAVENAIMKKQMNGTDTVTLNTTYTVQSDGSICIVEGDTCKSGTTITIDVDGILPDVGGIITINEKGVVTDYTLTVSGTSIVKGTPSSDESSDTICTLISGTSKTKGAKYSCRVNDTKTFNFYITGMNSDNSINLIMDRNICSSGNAETKSDRCSTAWLSVEDSDETAEYSSEDGAIITNTHGPITALNYLKQATSTWTNIDYNYGELVDEGRKYSNISLSGYHARMPKFSDFYEGTINEFMSAYQNDSTIVCNSNNSYFYDNIDQSEGICVIKFKNILSDEAGETSHYWLSSSFESNDAFFIGMSGLGASSVTTGDLVANPNLGDDMGIRPVITISKNQLN